MKRLLILAAVLASLFASTFLILNRTGILTREKIEFALNAASSINPLYVALVVIALLFADLFVAVPTLTIAILAGYFLGAGIGGLSAFIGMLLAGVVGYCICWKYGPSLLLRIYKDEAKLREMEKVFSEHGAIVLLMCRAAPILPEVSCCLAGATRMPFLKFITFYVAATAPYSFIAAYAGSQSTLADPMPAIFTAVAMSLVLWSSWAYFLRRNYGKTVSEV